MQNKKLRVLIVDDEFNIAMLIKKLIQWEKIGLECVNVVDNGEAAYNIISNEKPDIVITDIRMPKINGLDLISMTKKVNGNIYFIVISGYKEFEYAHKALQYGVNDYLLKPVNEEELNKVLEKIHDEILREGIRQQEGEQIKKTISASEQIIKSNLLNNIIDQADYPTVQEMVENYHLLFNAGAYRGIDIKLDYWDYEKNDKRQDMITIDKVMMFIDNNVKGHVYEYMICKKPNLNIYCLINYDPLKSKVIKNIINNILSEIQQYLIGFEQYKITIGIGSEITEFENIKKSIQDSYKAAQNRIMLGTGRLIYSDLLHLEKQIDTKKYLDPYKEQYLMSIESLTRESLENTIHQIYGAFQPSDNLDFSGFYDIANELIDLFFGHITVQSNEGKQLKIFMKNAYQHCYTLNHLTKLLKDYLGNYLETCLKQLEIETAKPIRQAKQYISEHYSEKIILEDIAAIVDLNPVYFSVLFKKETGMNFSTYLVHIRMEIAKEMIRSTNKTVAAIADEVGYKDTRHFSQTFSKTVGVKPALYRKLYS